MPDPRILLLTHEFAPFRGGIAEVADGLATGAAAAGYTPILLAPDYGADHTAADRTRPYEVRRFAGSTCSMVSIDRNARFTRLCRRVIRDVRPDLVHAVDPPAQMALAMLSRFRLPCRSMCTIHGTELLRYRNELVPRLWLGRGLRRATALHAVSRHVRDRIVRWFRVSPQRIVVVNPGIRRIWLDTPKSVRAAVRRSFGLRDEDFVLLTLARRVPEKGHEAVIDALATLPDAERMRIAYVVAGGGPVEYAHRLTATAHNANIRLILTDEVDDSTAIALADAADLFIMVSQETRTRLEGFGIAYIEAAARGLPSIARATGGTTEAVLDRETGRVIDATAGPAESGHLILDLMKHDETRAQLGRSALTRAQAFAWEKQAAALYQGW